MLFLIVHPEWRNWQTRWTQNPVVLSTVWVRPPPPGPFFPHLQLLLSARFGDVLFRPPFPPPQEFTQPIVVLTLTQIAYPTLVTSKAHRFHHLDNSKERLTNCNTQLGER